MRKGLNDLEESRSVPFSRTGRIGSRHALAQNCKNRIFPSEGKDSVLNVRCFNSSGAPCQLLLIRQHWHCQNQSMHRRIVIIFFRAAFDSRGHHVRYNTLPNGKLYGGGRGRPGGRGEDGRRRGGGGEKRGGGVLMPCMAVVA